MSLVRSRWAAIGAAVAVTLGAGGLISVNAASETSSLVPITPARILDTRSGDRVGSLDTAGASDPYRLKVIGTDGIPTSGVTGVSLSVTAVDTRTNDYGGFVSVYPCASVSTSKPDVSNMNFGSGQTIANAVTVPVSVDGHICLYVYGTAHLLVDANGYYTQAGTGDVDAYTKSETDTKLDTKANQTALDTLASETDTKLDTKANQTALDTLASETDTKLDTKANQTALDTLDADKADESALLALATTMQTPFTVDDSDGSVGEYTSIAIGNNGLPVISYYDSTNTALKVAACTSSDCKGAAAITTIDSTGNVGRYSSIALRNNGLPVISYYDMTNNDLKVAACTSTDCTGTPTITAVDSDGFVGEYTSIAIGNNGRPVISYFDRTNNDLKVATCTTTNCSSSTITTVDSTGFVGADTSIVIGDNGYPVISYYDGTNEDLKVAACTSSDCTGTAVITTIDSTGDVGWYTSIAIGNNGLPIISYLHAGNTELRVAACTSTDCTGTAVITTIDSNDPFNTSIAISSNGLPVISYYNWRLDDLKVATCTTANCSSSTITTVDSIGDVGADASMAIGATGLPVISYYDGTNGDLKVIPMWSLMIEN